MESFENIKSAKERLKDLESEGKYLFHGSPTGDIKVFEPRQGKHVPDMNKPTETINDGDPAISATPYSDIAIFRAILNRKNIGIDNITRFGSRVSKGEVKLQFFASPPEVLDRIKGKVGYVYVFNRSDFEPYNRDDVANESSMEWRSYQEVEPIDVIEVTSDDLPDENQIETK